ncbi:hypothetical protein Adt_33483 [Abeliophyllum distichum]|uniref:Uncharacterized protein n=1 Tax=Abeliophyllum distichum TaxID=126358 RepID=A0ABD1QXN6_9LAMI
MTGVSRGINLEKVWQANEKRLLSIVFDNVEQTMQLIENNTKYFTHLIRNQSYFDLQGNRSPDEYWAVCAVVDHLAADHYRDYKFKAHNHLKEHRLSRPYGEMSAEEWQKCIDFFTSFTFMEWSTKNKVNRDKAKYPSV